MSDDHATPPRIPAAIWAMGFVSMLADISSELIHSLLPVFMVSVLGTSALMVGLVDGAAEATQMTVKMLSGPWSDYLGRRKGLVVLGYGLGAISKPLFALATSAGGVLAARLIDRTGKGIRGAPRDALVADIAPPALRGAAYGLRQSLDTVGAFLGPLLATLLLLRSNDFRAVFWVAVIPGVLSVVVLVLGVHEPERSADARRVNPFHWRELKRFGADYWWVVVIGILFTLARFSEAFLVLRALQLGLPAAWAPMVLVMMNVVYALSAYPFGDLSDRVSHTKLLALGLAVLASADVVLAASDSITVALVGVALWGLHMGMTQGLLATMVADASPAEIRGTGFGLFNLTSGFAMLVGSVLAGFLWDRLGSSFAFGGGSIFCAAALLVLMLKARAGGPR